MMNLGNLVNRKNDVLKAEIGSLLFNLGKTHIGISNWKNYFPLANQQFSSYRDYYKNGRFEKELTMVNSKLKDFVFLNTKVILPDNLDIPWKNIFFGNAIESNEKGSDFIQKIFFRGCENINSGIDKGSPQDSNQLKSLWISNAFGSFKKEVTDENDFDASRLCFLRDLHRFLEDNYYYNSPNWVEIRNFVFKEIKPWYSRLLSDSRFPVNDVTLWEQAYMTASMFKATLAGLYLDNSKDKTGKTRLERFLENPQTIKWSILGIQYDKLGLAEKGLKTASIKWYRDISEKVDNEIKKLLEIDYPLGNEVYRDETGIYFVVVENIKGQKDGHFYKLDNSLSSIKSKIQETFANKFGGEVYPAIFLTESSRGLMNLGHLVEEARGNFLKAEIPDNFKDYLEDDSNPNGICQICGMRLAHKDNKENLICDVCLKRQKNRIDDWFKHLKGETIWTDELQDKNGRIALITLKFELDKWINGDLVNSLLVRQEKYNEIFCNLKNLLNESRKFSVENHKSYYQQNKNYFIDFLSLFDSSIKNVFKKLVSNLDKILNKSYKDIEYEINQIQHTIKKGSLSKNQKKKMEKNLQNLKLLYPLKKTLKNYLCDGRFSMDLKYNSDGCFEILNSKNQNDIKNQVAFAYLYILISNLVLERSIGNEWENFIKSNLSDPNVIDFDKRKIEWDKLADQDIEFLTNLILQFLLRKNPSPARLKRIWETTRKFFEDLESKITELAEIPNERRKRLVWNNVNIEDGEYQDGDILFWAKDKTVYLISSIERVRDKNGFKKNEFKLKRYDNKNDIGITLNTNSSQEQSYDPYFTILSPTPISWQFIIPAEYVPNLIKNIQEEYYKNFKWVYGKLPLHIGIVVQNYKRPLYVGIKALRKIRRDKQEWKYLGKDIPARDFKARQKEAFHYQENLEQVADCENFYSLFERADGNQKRYNFYLYPYKKPVWIDTTQNAADTDKFCFYRNTFDFEFLDTNTRRNDIFYEKAKRRITYKKNRPYDIENWQYFEKFREYFKDKKTSSKLHKLVSLIYSKLEDWKGDYEAVKTFMLSAFTNILGLNQENQDKFAGILGLEDWKELKELEENSFIEKLYMFWDMFEFWHTTLKEV